MRDRLFFPGFGIPNHLNSFDFTKHSRRRVSTGNHCFGCTAGHGSSCGDNKLAINRLNKVVDNVVHFMKLRVDRQLNWSPEGKKLRRVHYVAM